MDWTGCWEGGANAHDVVGTPKVQAQISKAEAQTTLMPICGEWVAPDGCYHELTLDKDGCTVSVKMVRPDNKIINSRSLISVDRRADSTDLVIVWGSKSRP